MQLYIDISITCINTALFSFVRVSLSSTLVTTYRIPSAMFFMDFQLFSCLILLWVVTAVQAKYSCMKKEILTLVAKGNKNFLLHDKS